VIDPVRGFYDVPVATLDFESLYPSIMRARNFCYSTLMTDEQRARFHPDNYEVTPIGVAFVRAPIQFDAAKVSFFKTQPGIR
jgi:DNA polymerase delta subunit 1